MAMEDLERMLERFRALCKADPRVVAAFVGGSLATGTADDYSDLDLYLITGDVAYDGFYGDRRRFMEQLGEPVYLEDFNGFGFDMILFIYADGCQGELGLARASHFLHIHGGPYRVLVDKGNLLRGVDFPLEQVTAEAQRHNLAGALDAFWRQLYLLTGALRRGQLLTAARYLEGMRRELVRVCRLATDFTDGGDHPPAERLLPAEQLAALGRTFPRLERSEVLAAAREAVRLFRRVAVPLAEVQGVPYPEGLEGAVSARLAEAVAKEADCGSPAGVS